MVELEAGKCNEFYDVVSRKHSQQLELPVGRVSIKMNDKANERKPTPHPLQHDQEFTYQFCSSTEGNR